MQDQLKVEWKRSLELVRQKYETGCLRLFCEDEDSQRWQIQFQSVVAFRRMSYEYSFHTEFSNVTEPIAIVDESTWLAEYKKVFQIGRLHA